MVDNKQPHLFQKENSFHSEMFEISPSPKLVERAYLVGIRWRQDSLRDAQEHLQELTQLCVTMGVPVVGGEVVSLARPHPAL
ncbi:MAG: hypothetical protein NTX50_24750 [Candidatus Sumerlaeota bacterium]|nr:hypothetical protein [Candidatus Sumerlaeota bacterium]